MDLFGNPGSTTSNSETQFYEQLFRSFDTQNFGTVQGGQVFGFFLSSGLTKAALGDIWDEATQKHSGGLSVPKFINAMKLIALAQRGIAPKLANIAQNPLIGLAQMQYPSHITKPTPSPQQIDNDMDKDKDKEKTKSVEPDPFGALGALPSGLGFDDMNGNGNVMETKPSGPSWNTAPNIDEEENTQEDDASAIAIATTDNQMNQYAPPTHNKQHAPTLTVEHMVAPEVGMSDVTPGLTRRISSKILYQEERLREQIRTAAQREKLAKKQANTQRIENERLERENEQLKFQINAARQAQADALHQSQEALTSIQPMRVENEKLKQAINQWKELIQTKDEELEALEAEVDQLRLENEKLENVLRDDKSKVDDIQFKLERSDALLQELTTKNRDCEAQINELMKDKVALEDDKRNLDLKVAQIKDEMKKLKRNQNSGLGLDRNSLKQKEADLFNISLNMTAAAPVVVENDDIVPPGSHDFNFMEEDEEEPAQPDEDPEEDEEEEEPEMIDKVIIEQSEVEEDVVKTVLFDDEYKASPWYMSVTDMTNYHKYFIQADLNKDGVIDGNEANKFFTKSKLNRKLLAKIWVLADQKKQAKLSEKMFCVMFHIVMKIKKSANKLSVPTELPACLTVDVVEKLGTKIQKTVKEKKIVNQKKIIKVENPNKKKKKKKKKSKPKPAQNENNKTNDALDFSDNWGNDTDSNWNQFDTKPTEKTETTQIAEQNGADSNWNEFGNFFDQ